VFYYFSGFPHDVRTISLDVLLLTSFVRVDTMSWFLECLAATNHWFSSVSDVFRNPSGDIMAHLTNANLTTAAGDLLYSEFLCLDLFILHWSEMRRHFVDWLLDGVDLFLLKYPRGTVSWPQPLPSTFFLFCYSLIILSFDVDNLNNLLKVEIK
jgi:hypothetical protein